MEKADRQKRVYDFLVSKGFELTVEEQHNIEIADVGLNQFDEIGMGIVTYVNNENYCAKELVLFENQTFPEHIHAPIGEFIGKRETFRCRYGVVYLYIEGEATDPIIASLPKNGNEYFTVRKEIILYPGEQYTIEPNIWHWFQAGPEGAIVSEFSTPSRDELDLFRDPRITRVTK